MYLKEKLKLQYQPFANFSELIDWPLNITERETNVIVASFMKL